MMIEEAQSMVNRMEASLEDGGDVKKMLDKRSSLSREVKELKKKVKELKEDIGDGESVEKESSRGGDLRSLLEELDD